MANQTLLLKGESMPFVFDRSGESIDGWICNIQIKKFPTDGSNDYNFVPRLVEPDTSEENWPGILTSADIVALTANGPFRLVGLLTSALTGEQEQVPLRFHVAQSWAA